MMVDRYGIKYLESLSNGAGPKDSHPLAEAILEDIDWDPALRNANRWYDRLVAALRETNRSSREKKLDQIDKEIKNLKEGIVEGEAVKLIVGDKKANGEVVGDILISLLMPAVNKVQTAHDRVQQLHQNLCIAFALAWYQRDHGRYPANLDQLAPKYLAGVPRDLFSGRALIYRTGENGYLFYSIGPNGKDEQGRGSEERPQGDDLGVRMPLPEMGGK
jgi:hypothetical protein